MRGSSWKLVWPKRRRERTTARQGRKPGRPRRADRNVCEHALYERTGCSEPGQRERLALALFGPAPALLGWVIGDPGALHGYATATIDFSTWTAARYLHMDCLFVRANARGQGLGQRLLDAVKDAAIVNGIENLQWQTPLWNIGAQRFYERCGARAAAKQRYTLRLARDETAVRTTALQTDEEKMA